MSDTRPMSFPDLSGQSLRRRWLILVCISAAVIAGLRFLHVPAYFLIGAMASAIVLAVAGGAVRIPLPLFFFSQGVVGCLIGRSVTVDILHDIAEGWPLFILMVASVSVVCFLLGWLLTKSKTLPGTTAIWGTSPGAALVMTIMSESYGADSRLVALMQYMRLVLVTLSATVVASVWGGPARALAASGVMPGFDWLGFGQTIILSGCSALIGRYSRWPSGPILFPVIAGSFLNVSGVIHLELPYWLLYLANCVVGWGIGLRFTRQIVAYAFRALPKIAATIVGVIVLCGLIAIALGYIAGIDPLTAYFATSPGGMDAIALITASMAGINTSFVMAVQLTRFFLVSLTSPPLASFIVKRSGLANKKDSVRMRG